MIGVHRITSGQLTFLEVTVPHAPSDAVDRADSDAGAIGVGIINDFRAREKLV